MDREPTFIGPYRVLRPLGRGALGDVLLAEQSAHAGGAPTQVAIKVLGAPPTDPSVRDLMRQVEAAAGLGQKHIIPYYGAVQDGDASVGLVMAYAPGGSLGDSIEHGAHLPLPLHPDTVARIIAQLGFALQQAHDAGLIHGDLKPSNVFIRTSPQGRPIAVLSDFGQAVEMQMALRTATNSTSDPRRLQWAAKQLQFAAPEQARGVLSPASDQYALAALAYLLVTGVAPIHGDGASLANPARRPPIMAPSRHVTTLSRDADRVILQALANDPASRFPSIGAFAAACSQALSDSGESERSLRNGATPPRAGGLPATDPRSRASQASLASPGEEDESALPPDATPRTRRRLMTVAIIAALAVLLSCGVSTALLTGNAGPLHLQGDVGKFLGPNVAPTVAPTATGADNQAATQVAEARLATITAHAPVFTDPLTANTQGWPVDNKTSFFRDGQLHLNNQSASSPAFIRPKMSALSGMDVRVTVAIARGDSGDQAGPCFFSASNGAGKLAFYCYLVSSEGHYEVWLYQEDSAGGRSGWTYINGGYAAGLKLGVGGKNTLDVVASAKLNSAVLFANGHYVGTVRLPADGPTSGGAGMLTLNVGSEAAFSQFAVFSATS